MPEFHHPAKRIANTGQRVAIPSPGNSLEGIHATVMALKEAVEILMRERGHADDQAVTWGDLRRMGLAQYDDQVPVESPLVAARRHP